MTARTRGASTGSDHVQDSYPACRDTGDCVVGESCENGVCLLDPPESGPLEDGALTTPVSCNVDSECFGGAFCDLAACTGPMVNRSGEGFGGECSEDTECYGYICKANRCRSCASSDECDSDLQCYMVPERGQRCVTLEEATALDWDPAPSR